jgi:hypothetical protein
LAVADRKRGQEGSEPVREDVHGCVKPSVNGRVRAALAGAQG